MRFRLHHLFGEGGLGIKLSPKKGDLPRKQLINLMAKDPKVEIAFFRALEQVAGSCPPGQNPYEKDTLLGDLAYTIRNFNKAGDAQKGAVFGLINVIKDSELFKSLSSYPKIVGALDKKVGMVKKTVNFREPLMIHGGETTIGPGSAYVPSAGGQRRQREKTGSAIIANNLSIEQGKGELQPDYVHPDALMDNQALPLDGGNSEAMTDISSFTPTSHERYSLNMRNAPPEKKRVKIKMLQRDNFPEMVHPENKLKRKIVGQESLSDKKLKAAQQLVAEKGSRVSDAPSTLSLNPTAYAQSGQGTGGKTTMGGQPGSVVEKRSPLLLSNLQNTGYQSEERSTNANYFSVQHQYNAVKEPTPTSETSTTDPSSKEPVSGPSSVSWWDKWFGGGGEAKPLDPKLQKEIKEQMKKLNEKDPTFTKEKEDIASLKAVLLEDKKLSKEEGDLIAKETNHVGKIVQQLQKSDPEVYKSVKSKWERAVESFNSMKYATAEAGARLGAATLDYLNGIVTIAAGVNKGLGYSWNALGKGGKIGVLLGKLGLDYKSKNYMAASATLAAIYDESAGALDELYKIVALFTPEESQALTNPNPTAEELKLRAQIIKERGQEEVNNFRNFQQKMRDHTNAGKGGGKIVPSTSISGSTPALGSETGSAPYTVEEPAESTGVERAPKDELSTRRKMILQGTHPQPFNLGGTTGRWNGPAPKTKITHVRTMDGRSVPIDDMDAIAEVENPGYRQMKEDVNQNIQTALLVGGAIVGGAVAGGISGAGLVAGITEGAEVIESTEMEVNAARQRLNIIKNDLTTAQQELKTAEADVKEAAEMHEHLGETMWESKYPTAQERRAFASAERDYERALAKEQKINNRIANSITTKQTEERTIQAGVNRIAGIKQAENTRKGAISTSIGVGGVLRGASGGNAYGGNTFTEGEQEGSSSTKTGITTPAPVNKYPGGADAAVMHDDESDYQAYKDAYDSTLDIESWRKYKDALLQKYPGLTDRDRIFRGIGKMYDWTIDGGEAHKPIEREPGTIAPTPTPYPTPAPGTERPNYVPPSANALPGMVPPAPGAAPEPVPVPVPVRGAPSGGGRPGMIPVTPAPAPAPAHVSGPTTAPATSQPRPSGWQAPINRQGETFLSDQPLDYWKKSGMEEAKPRENAQLIAVNENLPDTKTIPLLRPSFADGGADLLSTVLKNPNLQSINRLVWQSFNTGQWDANQESDNDLNMINIVEDAWRFSGELNKENKFEKQCEDAITEEYAREIHTAFDVPEQVMKDAVPVIQDIIPQPNVPTLSSETELLFHDVFLPPWIEIPASSPWNQFTAIEGNQIPDTLIKNPNRITANDWPLLAPENAWISNTLE